MAVLIKDVKNFPKDAPTELLFEKNKDFIAKYGKRWFSVARFDYNGA